MESSHCFWDDLFSEDELNKIIEYCDTFQTEEGVTGFDGDPNHAVRKSNLSWIYRDFENDWIFSRIEFVVNKLNTKFFGFDIYRLNSLQYTLYDQEGSHYNWHWDMYDSNPLDSNDSMAQRKVSAVLQLSSPEEYEGGDLEISPGGTTKVIEKRKGHMSVFPSFVLHRVTPIESGKRRTLVAWFTGPDWR